MRKRSPNSSRGDETRRSRGTTSAAPDSRAPSSALRSVACDLGALSGEVGRSGVTAAKREAASISARTVRPGRRNCRTQRRGDGNQSLCSEAPISARSSRSSRFRSSSLIGGGTAGLRSCGDSRAASRRVGRPPGDVRATSCARSSSSSCASRPSLHPSLHPSFLPSGPPPVPMCRSPAELDAHDTDDDPKRQTSGRLKRGGCGR